MLCLPASSAVHIAAARLPARCPQANVPNITAAPYYYNGTNTSRQNLATNVSITVSSRVGGYSQLYSILNTPAVAANISANPSITNSERDRLLGMPGCMAIEGWDPVQGMACLPGGLCKLPGLPPGM